MSKKLLAVYVSLLLFSVVAGTQVVKVVKANFVPIPNEPEPITVTMQTPTNRTYFQENISINFSVKKPFYGNIDEIICSVDGQAYEQVLVLVSSKWSETNYSATVTVKDLSDGWHVLTVTASGLSSYNANPEGYAWADAYVSGSASIDFLFDMVPPKISVLSPQNKTYNANDVPLNFNLSELAKWIGYSLDSQTNVTITGNTTLPQLSDGSHSLTIYANDAVGRFGTSETVYFAVDTVLPRISFISPKNKTYYKDNITLSFTVDEAVSWLAYILDGQENVTINGNVTLTELSDGSHSLTIYARDLSGNTGTSETIYFTTAQPSGFLGSTLPIEYGYVLAAETVAVTVIAGYFFLKRKNWMRVNE